MTDSETAGPQPDASLLVVEDDHAMQQLLRLTFERSGFRVKTASDGMEGLELLASFQADAVVTDLSMPRLDGCRMIRTIRARAAAGIGPPVLVITGLPSGDPLVQCAQGEARVSVIYKPPTFKELPLMVRGLLAA